MDYRDLSDDAITLTNWLVAIPSVSGTKGEAVIIKAIYDGLCDFNYFKKNKDLISYISYDNEKSASITALVRSENTQVNDTIILLCNVDTSNLDKYSNYKNIAYKIDELLPKLKKSSKDSKLLSDLETDEYLFGVGVYESKAAAGTMISALKYFTENNSTLACNILFVCTSESINSSRGIKEALPIIAKLQEQYDLNFKLCLNAKPALAYEDKKENYIYTSHQGQAEIGLYIIGKGTNPAMPFNGFSPSLLTSILIKNIELNPNILKKVGLASVPTFNALNYKSSRLGMSPEIMQLSFIFNLKGTSIDDVIEELKDTVATSLEECSELLDDRENIFATLNKEVFISEVKDAEVLTYANLLKRAQKHYQGDLNIAIESLVYKCQNEGLNAFQTTSSIIDRLNDLCHLPRPSIVIFTGDRYIPEQSVQENNVKDRETLIHIHKAIDYLSDKNKIVPKLKKHFVPNDINFMRPVGLDKALREIEKNTALSLGNFYNLNAPCITLTLKGHDLYNISERIEKSQIKYINDFIFSIIEAFDKTIIDSKDKLSVKHEKENKVSDIASSILNQTFNIISKGVDNIKKLKPTTLDEKKEEVKDVVSSNEEIKKDDVSLDTKEDIKSDVDPSSDKEKSFDTLDKVEDKALESDDTTQSLDLDKDAKETTFDKETKTIEKETIDKDDNSKLKPYEVKTNKYHLDEKGFKNISYDDKKTSSLNEKTSYNLEKTTSTLNNSFTDFKTSSSLQNTSTNRGSYISQNSSVNSSKTYNSSSFRNENRTLNNSSLNKGTYINTPIGALNKAVKSTSNTIDSLNKPFSTTKTSSFTSNTKDEESLDITHKIINTDELNKIKSSKLNSYNKDIFNNKTDNKSNIANKKKTTKTPMSVNTKLGTSFNSSSTLNTSNNKKTYNYKKNDGKSDDNLDKDYKGSFFKK